MSQQYEQIDFICNQYSEIKDFVFERYSGIRHLEDVFDAKNTKTELNKLLSESFKRTVPYKYQQEAVLESLSNIQSSWSNLFNRVGYNLRNNSNMTQSEMLFGLYVLAAPRIMHSILNYKEYDFVKKSTVFKDVNYRKVEQYLRRQVRKFKFNAPKSKKKRSICIEPTSYTFKDGVLKISGLIAGKRIQVKLSDNIKSISNKNLRLVLDRDNKRCQIIIPMTIKQKVDDGTKQLSSRQKANLIPSIDKRELSEVGIDVNYSNILTTDKGDVYADGVGKLDMRFTKCVVEKEKKRQAIRMQVRELQKQIDNSTDQKLIQRLGDKIKRIEQNNLGSKKITKQKAKIVETYKSLVNYSINQMIYKYKPTKIVLEDLSKKVKKKSKSKFKKEIAHGLNNWRKTYLNQRLEYKCLVFQIEIQKVNAAYTSQVCSHCQSLEGRAESEKFKCSKCGYTEVAHINAAKNILGRSNDSEITIYTKYTKVKDIINDRYKNKIAA